MANNPAAGSQAPGTTETGISTRWYPWIDGREYERADETFSVFNPANGVEICRVTRGGESEVDAAVRAASVSLPNWGNMVRSKRAGLLYAVGAALRQQVEEFARLETLDNGKPISDARADVEKSAAAFEFYAGLADKIFGSTIPVSPEFLNYTVKEPIGVTAHICPWNYPLRLLVRSLAPALAAGNTAVIKPAEETPLSALRLARLLSDVGLPAGVCNVVPGLGEEAGAALARHPDINHISFTGSVETGITVMRAAAGNVVPVVLELGGKSPNIVFADANSEAAIDGAITAIFANAGQVCCAGSRLLIENGAYDAIIAGVVARAEAMSIGPGMEDPDMGPLISQSQQARVLEYIGLGEEEGGRVITGGGVPESAGCKAGYFVKPTVIEGLSNRSRVAQEEIFGPVLTALRFSDEEDAVRIANESPFGLVAGVWTADLDRAHRMASLLQVGQVYVNDFFSGSVASPFGGYKRSGFGRERGVEALNHYVQTKSVCLRFRS